MSNTQMTIPMKLEQDVENAVNYLVNVLLVKTYESETHDALVVSGWNNDNDTRRAVAVYLVGLCESAIDSGLNIRAALTDDGAEGAFDIYAGVCGIVKESNSELTNDQKEDERNPWIAEGLWHLCMLAASRKQDIHPLGNIISVGPAHVRAKDHGLDGLAIYKASEDTLGLTIIESKAYKLDPNRAINKAVKFFREIDEHKHSARIKHSVSMMRIALSSDLQELVSGSFWKSVRTYVPNPHYDISENIDWTNKRPSFENLKTLSKKNILVMPHIIDNFDNFFDEISDNMRDYARGFAINV
ncbi:hypothetical protein [Paenibacillus sp. GCM10012303]|uniref:hypothetical protein n=1 Tax=Paenibacillus sp. GCM10012303 TaxID=3317340 RepID=UPI003612C122